MAHQKVEHDAGDRETVPAIYAFRTPLGTAEIRLPPDPTDNTPLLGVHINFRNEPPNKWADLYPSGHVMIAEYVGADPTTADTVEAQEVKVGDRIYNASAQKWVQVKSIAAHEGYVVLETPAWSTWKHPKEAVAVERRESSVNEFVSRVLASIDTMRAGKPAPRAENPIRPRTTEYASEIPCSCGAGGAEWRDVGTGGRSYMCDACASAVSETEEMAEMLRQHDFVQPEHAARKLAADGIGPEELRSRLRHPAGSVGSLEYTHGLQSARGARETRARATWSSSSRFIR